MNESTAIQQLAEILDVSPAELEADVQGARRLLDACHTLSVRGGWWNDPCTGKPLQRNRAEMLCLMHSEISEAMEAERKGLDDDKLPHRPGAEVELADLVVRTGDYGGGHGYDIIGALVEKLVFNQHRADHKPENRAKAGGKAF